jgi:hypothetical protein
MVALIKADSRTSDLSTFLKDELYEKWKTDRLTLETKWQENEDAFDGVAAGTWKVEEGEDWRSDAVVQMTKNKIITAYSMVIDIALEGGLLPFNLAPSPWDEVNFEDLPPDQQEIVEDAISDMNGLIHQQILDCQGTWELMKCTMAAAKLGETYWKTFVHDVTRKGFEQSNMSPPGGIQQPGIQNQYQQWQYFEKVIKSPGFKYVSTWDMFRDLETDDLQTSRGYCERSYVSPYDLRQLLGKGEQYYYIDDAIKRVIANSGASVGQPRTDRERPGRRNIQANYNNIERLDFWCRVPRETLERFQYEQNPDEKKGEPPSGINLDYDNDGDEVEVGVVHAGDEVIRLIPNVKPGTRPHGRTIWEMRLDDNKGAGIADNLKNTQKTANGAWRAYIDNKALSANVMSAGKKGAIEDWDGVWKPGTHVTLTEETKSVSDAFTQIIVQDVGESLLSLIGLCDRRADEDSMLPNILQGSLLQKQKPDTLGEIQILQSNSGKYIGGVFKNFDAQLFEPVTWRFYEYNMKDPGLTHGKGSYIAKPMGFSLFRDKVIRVTKILQAIQLVMSAPPIQGDVRLKFLFGEVFKSLEIDTDQVWKSKEEKAADAEAMAQAQQAQQQAIEMQILAKFKNEIDKIMAQNSAKLEQMEAEHRNRMAELEEESNNRIVEKKIAPPPIQAIPGKPGEKKEEIAEQKK